MKRTVVRDQAGSVVLYVVLAVVVLVVLALGIWRIGSHKATPNKPATTNNAPSAKASGSATSKPLTSGIDNDSLSKDVTNIGASVDEGTQNMQSATTATNDESQVVDVPTN